MYYTGLFEKLQGFFLIFLLLFPHFCLIKQQILSLLWRNPVLSLKIIYAMMQLHQKKEDQPWPKPPI